jgi:hypothetical protein
MSTTSILEGTPERKPWNEKSHDRPEQERERVVDFAIKMRQLHTSAYWVTWIRSNGLSHPRLETT